MVVVVLLEVPWRRGECGERGSVVFRVEFDLMGEWVWKLK
jgi:hypothetical protein